MFNPVVQYSFIGIVFIVAVGYVVQLFRGSFGSIKSCSKGGGGDDTKATDIHDT
ncbi:MAG: FeoB-associated Cys-rich membrane protein [Moheibacter sp.]